ncbi:MAG: Lrp/AsnC ligand binding domain-containing protein [Candidatus Odinarchaeum yellowstonii]|uniref:Lrp/AsnC ligand binding domain-containing protein n=1 Tax=Odinarchaeota yellowstonii (strain LCB_4) TaxID=1841599 RepID=A0AAF0D368_ODILC|nr:MAG: Lrp/AsnC ligand binding domain-containing protein [Candidatus Odinarchaeum yellowstonii]
MIKAYIMLTLALGDTKRVLEEIKKLEHIDSISVVTGHVDVVLTVSVNNIEELYELTYEKLSNIKGITSISTHIVEKEMLAEEEKE